MHGYACKPHVFSKYLLNVGLVKQNEWVSLCWKKKRFIVLILNHWLLSWMPGSHQVLIRFQDSIQFDFNSHQDHDLSSLTACDHTVPNFKLISVHKSIHCCQDLQNHHHSVLVIPIDHTIMAHTLSRIKHGQSFSFLVPPLYLHRWSSSLCYPW